MAKQILFKATFLDRAIGVFSPSTMRERVYNRGITNQLEKRKYEGASSGRRTDGWQSSGVSANAEINFALRKLRERSRELTRNNSYAKKGIQVIANNTIGTGILPSISGTNKTTEKRIKSLWKSWAEKTKCDFDGRKTFAAIQRLCMKSLVESGEVLVVRRRENDKNLPLPFQVQILESDFLDQWKNQVNLDGGGYIMMGIEFNKRGKKVAYWLYDTHPGETLMLSTLISHRVPASDVIHLYSEERPGQIRGVPFAASGMVQMKDLKDYDDAQLLRQKIAACFAAFVTDTAGADVNDMNEYEALSHIEPGTIEYLPQGKEMKFAEPPPAEGYSDYNRKMVQQVALSFGTSYEALSGDLSNVNFSSGRMGWLEFHRNVTEWQNDIIIALLCDGVYDWFLEAAIIAGKISENHSAVVTWTPPRREMIDPVKEGKALIELVRGGLLPWSYAVMGQGYEPEEVLEQIKKDNAAFDAAGIILSSDARYIMQAVKVEDGGGDGADASGDAAKTSNKKDKNKKNPKKL